MGSGPMQTGGTAGKKLFDHIPSRDSSAVGVLQWDRFLDEAVAGAPGEKLGLSPGKISLLVAPAGGWRGICKSFAFAGIRLHKLHELKFDLNQVLSGLGSAPCLPSAIIC